VGLPILVAKKLVCFLHVPKAAGSSVWATIADAATSDSRKPHVVDSFYDATRILGERFDPKELDAAALPFFGEYISEFRKSPQEIMFLHHHSLGFPELPNDMNVDIIVIARDPVERLNSALRHWLGGAKEGNYDNITWRFLPYWTSMLPYKAWSPNEFFYDHLARGYDQFFDRCFGDNWYAKSNFGFEQNVNFFSFNAEIAINRFVGFLKCRYGLKNAQLGDCVQTRTRGGLFYRCQCELHKDNEFEEIFQASVELEKKALKHFTSMTQTIEH
jgi:hypothetical protein